MPKLAALSGRRQAQQMICTFHVHQVSVNDFFDFAPVCHGAAAHLGHRG